MENMEIEYAASDKPQQSQCYSFYTQSPINPRYIYNDITNPRYLIIQTLGKSKQKVKLAMDCFKNVVALKIFRFNSTESKENYYNEKSTYNKLTWHPHLINCIEFLEHQIILDKKSKPYTYSALVLEYCPNYSLFEYILCTGALPEILCRTIFKQVLLGVQHMHQAKIAHLDLKLENLFVDKFFNVRIGDFDLSSNIKLQRITVGTLNYISPEIWEQKLLMGNEADVFALGVVLFSLMTGKSPFISAQKDDERYKWLAYNEPKAFWSELDDDFGSNTLSQEFKNIAEGMLCYDHNHRMTLDDIFNSEWMQGELAIESEYLIEMEKMCAVITEKKCC